MIDENFVAGSIRPGDGGAAFPTEGKSYYWHGMTLRDYFAAKAMAALIVAPKADWPDAEETESVSEKAYLMADAMLKERAK